MLLAHVDGATVEATPRSVGTCPGCGAEVRAKCGRINVWHWAHVSADCDPWSEPESQWHRDWKACAPVAQREVVMERDGVKHRADVVVRGKVLELQSSSISVDDIEARERFYGDMAWLFRVHWQGRLKHVPWPTAWMADARSYLNGRVHRIGPLGFLWKHPAPTLLSVTKPMFWDVSGEVWRVEIGEAAVVNTMALIRSGRSCNSDPRQPGLTDADFMRGPGVLGRITRRWSTVDFMVATFGKSVLGL